MWYSHILGIFNEKWEADAYIEDLNRKAAS
jgi:hypothetical protein